jgi:cytochrome c oxidase subunit 3
MSDPPVGLQYVNRQHQAVSAILGMWLFLATEILLFGALLFCYAVYRHAYPAGFVAAVRRTDLLIGTANTGILLTSGLVVTLAARLMAAGRGRHAAWACLATAGLGACFIALKGVEYAIDIGGHLVPGPDFAASGLREQGAELFFVFYYVATGLHGFHMMIGIGLLLYIARRAARGDFSTHYTTPVEVATLYWSFVDIVWIVLYPLIYLAGRGS